MRLEPSNRPFFKELIAISVAICWCWSTATFAGETCSDALTNFGWDQVVGAEFFTVHQEPIDPICAFRVNVGNATQSGTCEVWLGMVITDVPKTVEHRLAFDMKFLDLENGFPLTFFAADSGGQTAPTIELSVVGGLFPKLKMEWKSDFKTGTHSMYLEPRREHDVTIRWTAPIEANAGSLELTVDGQISLEVTDLTLDTTRPDMIRIGVLDCPHATQGSFIFDPLSTTFEHF